jgi:hypothetical protein
MGAGATTQNRAHFEGAESFGCNAGTKMVYVDAFGDVCERAIGMLQRVSFAPLPEFNRGPRGRKVAA